MGTTVDAREFDKGRPRRSRRRTVATAVVGVGLVTAAVAGPSVRFATASDSGPTPSSPSGSGDPTAGTVGAAGFDADDLRAQLDAALATGLVGLQADVRFGDGREPVVATAGVAELGGTEPVPDGGHFRIGSTTKTFVATVVLQLVEEGRLSLDDTVEDWLPGAVASNGNDGTRITVRDLLRHTSGLFDYLNDTAAFPADGGTSAGYLSDRFTTYTPEHIVAVATSHPPLFPPGSQYNYVNTDYIVLGMVVEAVTGRTWQQEVDHRIVCRLGLDDTVVPGTDPDVPGPHAHAYLELEGADGLTDTTLVNPSVAGAAGGIVSTPGDLHRFFRALLDGTLLGPELLAEMQTTVPAGNGTDYGLGLVWTPLPCGDGYWGHTGGIAGYYTLDGFTTSGRGVVLSATGPGSPEAEPAGNAIIADVLCSQG